MSDQPSYRDDPLPTDPQPPGYRPARHRPVRHEDLARLVERDQVAATVDDDAERRKECDRVAEYFGRLFKALQEHGFSRDEAYKLVEIEWTILFSERSK